MLVLLAQIEDSRSAGGLVGQCMLATVLLLAYLAFRVVQRFKK